jgi:hypothetical protein
MMQDHPGVHPKFLVRYVSEYPTLAHMIAKGIPLTRDNYIALNWFDEPTIWTAEHEADVPPPLREAR